jgi:hypothetical protein
MKAKPGAFLPSASRKTSAAAIDGLSADEIWKIGDVLASKGKPPRSGPRARADFDAEALVEAKLTIEGDPSPHPRHINLCGWPANKDEQKAIAMLLCNRSILQKR